MRSIINTFSDDHVVNGSHINLIRVNAGSCESHRVEILIVCNIVGMIKTIPTFTLKYVRISQECNLPYSEVLVRRNYFGNTELQKLYREEVKVRARLFWTKRFGSLRSFR